LSPWNIKYSFLKPPHTSDAVSQVQRVNAKVFYMLLNLEADRAIFTFIAQTFT